MDWLRRLFTRKKKQTELSTEEDCIAIPIPESSSANVWGYIARDKSGKLQLYTRPPLRFKWFGEWSRGIALLPRDNFPEVKWESGSVKVIINLTTTYEE